MKKIFWIFGAVVYALFIMFIFNVYKLKLNSDTVNSNEKFNFILKYGVEGKNIINTFNEKYTKDMVIDNPITVDYQFTKKQMQLIYQKMCKINILSYPKKYIIKSNSFVTPYETYYFKINIGNETKEIYWEDKNLANDKKSKDLRELINLITNIVHNSKEYKKLPQPRGGYD